MTPFLGAFANELLKLGAVERSFAQLDRGPKRNYAALDFGSARSTAALQGASKPKVVDLPAMEVDVSDIRKRYAKGSPGNPIRPDKPTVVRPRSRPQPLIVGKAPKAGGDPYASLKLPGAPKLPSSGVGAIASNWRAPKAPGAS